MLSGPGFVVASTVGAAVNLEAAAMYGLLALVVGLIAWSKYAEPALPPQYVGDDATAAVQVEQVEAAAADRADPEPSAAATRPRR